MKITKTTRQFGNIKIVAEIENSEEVFRWRLCRQFREINLLRTGWTSYYEGILSLKVGEHIFAYATDYWKGTLPTEEPFEIVLGKPL